MGRKLLSRYHPNCSVKNLLRISNNMLSDNGENRSLLLTELSEDCSRVIGFRAPHHLSPNRRLSREDANGNTVPVNAFTIIQIEVMIIHPKKFVKHLDESEVSKNTVDNKNCEA